VSSPLPCTQEKRGAISHVPALDGVRGIAVLAVLLYHVGCLPGGWLGVDMFFVLSGFLITDLLMRERQRTGRVSFRNFYARRGLRLLPALIAVLAVTTVWTAWFGPGLWGKQAWGSAALVLFYVGNVAMIRGRDLGLLGHTWSLGMEEQFYLVWPAVLAGLCRLGRVVTATLTAVAIGAVVAFRTYLLYRPAKALNEFTSLRRVSFSLDTRGEPVLIGCLVGLLVVWGVLRFLGRAFRPYWDGSALRCLAPSSLSHHGPSRTCMV
jgi:peptidoglycan/LPS O-acetylase OafA/YrhL